jgi:hypothetical protein
MNRVMVFAGAIFVAALSFSAAALAATPADEVYGGEGGNVQQDVVGDVAGAGTLPFTGLDLMLMAVAAGLLLGAGMTIRRLARAKA